VQDLGVFQSHASRPEPAVNRDKAAGSESTFSDVRTRSRPQRGKAVTSVLKGEERYDLAVRYQPNTRHRRGDRDIRLLRLPASVCRSANLRRSHPGWRLGDIPEGTSLWPSYGVARSGQHVEEHRSVKTVKLPRVIAGVAASTNRRNAPKAAGADHSAHAPGDLLILYSMFSSMKWASLILITVPWRRLAEF